MPTIEIRNPRSLYIDGTWVEPSGQDVFEVVNCATEEVVTAVAAGNSADVANAVAAARHAFDTGPWPRLDHGERAKYLRAIAQEFEARNDEFAAGWSIESGLVNRVARSVIGSHLAGAFNRYADLAETYPFIEPKASQAGNQAYLVREAVGVVAVIVPWNGPAALLAYKVAPALLAGCTVVIKSSPEAPTSAYLFAEICEKVGLPAGVVNVVTADRDVSAELVANPGIDKVTFTGSTAAGRKIFAACGERIARVTLELGGKSPAVILDDYDVDVAAATLASSYFGYLTGQVCHSLTRVIVPDRHHDRMVEALAEAGRALKIGDPFAADTQVGPLANARQRATVEGYIAKGKAEGAVLACGGSRPAHLDRGYFFEPTVFGEVDNRSTIAQEEIFGPVLSVIRARDDDHAIAMANDTIFGLNAAVFTNDHERFLRVSRQIRAGTVGHNGPRTDFSLAFGGFKQSGIGREGGTDGLLPFLEEKTVVMDRPFAAAS